MTNPANDELPKRIPTEPIAELFWIARCIAGILRQGEEVEEAYLDQLEDALDKMNEATGWDDHFQAAIAREIEKLTR